MRKRDVRHGLAEGDGGSESDEEHVAKRARVIEEPLEEPRVPESDCADVFGPSGMVIGSSDRDVPSTPSSGRGPEGPPDKKQRIANVDMTGGMAGIEGDGLGETGMGLFKALATEIGKSQIAPDIGHTRI